MVLIWSCPWCSFNTFVSFFIFKDSIWSYINLVFLQYLCNLFLILKDCIWKLHFVFWRIRLQKESWWRELYNSLSFLFLFMRILLFSVATTIVSLSLSETFILLHYVVILDNLLLHIKGNLNDALVFLLPC